MLRSVITSYSIHYTKLYDDFLSDAEIAAVVNYVRSHWGNDALHPPDYAELTPNDIANLRKNPKTPAEVHAERRTSLK